VIRTCAKVRAGSYFSEDSSYMKAVTYIEEAIKPGGTPKRYLVWVSVVLGVQILASVIPSPWFLQDFNGAHIILGIVSLLVIGVNFVKTDRQRILAAYFLYIVGLVVSTITISAGITSLSGIIYMLTWAMTLFIAERREYISFDLVTLFMVLMLLSTVVLLLFEPTMNVSENFFILGSGAILTGINIYLVYADFGLEKNFYRESRKRVSNLQLLTSKLADILSRREPLEKLLWQVSRECVPYLELEECVIYLYDEEKNVLKQVAAYGNKSTTDNHIVAPIVIEPGKGVVGSCFASGEEKLIMEVTPNTDYIVDDAERSSELAVPIWSKGQVVGVIDSEHTRKGFFSEKHVEAFNIVAAFCGIKITELYADESIQQAEEAKLETERIKELDELKNKFITNISHDLKTPLSLIKAPAMQIARLTGEKRVKDNADYIIKNTEHLLRVVNQLLQLNRVDQGLNELYIERVELLKLSEKLEKQYKGLAEKDNISFTVESCDLSLETDHFRLEQIIHNLVHNAFRYTGKNGAVNLILSYANDELLIEVSDNGPGIPEDMKSRIFDRFVKVDINNHEGTGIGLSLVKEYVQSLGGKVNLESTVGVGTKFIVHIPVQSSAESPKEKSSAVNLTEMDGKPEMLIVEDHPDLNAFIALSFEQDYNCVSAFDGQEALIKIRKNPPDVIITDLMMPKLDGNELIKEIRSNEEWAHIPIIVLSAKGQIESKVELYAIGADNYLVKPFNISELEAIVKGTCEQRKRLKSLFQTIYLNEEPDDEIIHITAGHSKSELVNQLISYVLDNIDEADLSVQRIGQDLGVGRNRLQKEVKESTGLTPVELIRSIRLKVAKEKLEDPRRQISEVAYQVGFNNLSYFSRSFKNEFNCLPTEWQERSRANSRD